MSTIIDSIIDGKTPYAYAFLSRSPGDYGHMTVNIRMDALEYGYRQNGVIKISCQIGSPDGGAQCELPYAFTYGLDSQSGCIRLNGLEQATKLMRKIERYLQKVENENGPADNFAEQYQRILLGSGIKVMIAEKGEGWAVGGAMRDKQIVAVGGASKKKLSVMEAALIGAFSRKAA